MGPLFVWLLVLFVPCDVRATDGQPGHQVESLSGPVFVALLALGSVATTR